MTSQSQLPTIQKTTFSNSKEFVQWLELVGEVADRHIDEIEVTADTFTMLIREWVAQRNYSWFNGPYSAEFGLQNGSLRYRAPWGSVLIKEANNA